MVKTCEKTSFYHGSWFDNALGLSGTKYNIGTRNGTSYILFQVAIILGNKYEFSKYHY